mgnify:CR=1 FL=1
MSRTDLHRTTVSKSRKDTVLERVLSAAHTTGWGRMHRMSTPKVRAHLGRLPWPLSRLAYGPERTDGVHITPTTLEGRHGPIPARVYDASVHPRAPLVVFFHGGGFVAGDLDSHHHICVSLARRAQAVLVAVDYRRAPEHRYPVAVHDAVDATRQLAERALDLGANPDRLTLCGDSAGGNLSAAAALMIRDEGKGPGIARILLAYPGTDAAMRGPSHAAHADAALLCAEDVRHFRDGYLGPELSGQTPRYFSLVDVDDLQDLPPAIITVAGRDPLRDDGATLARKLAAAGNDVEVVEYSRAIHGYWLLPGVSPAAVDTTARFAKAILGHQVAG